MWKHYRPSHVVLLSQIGTSLRIYYGFSRLSFIHGLDFFDFFFLMKMSDVSSISNLGISSGRDSLGFKADFKDGLLQFETVSRYSQCSFYGLHCLIMYLYLYHIIMQTNDRTLGAGILVKTNREFNTKRNFSLTFIGQGTLTTSCSSMEHYRHKANTYIERIVSQIVLKCLSS